ncbi:hypothetical protein [Streptomyces griseosporeus]|uniref:hypothetical protein n=1 Tax=Streptomyces griseosporeus TaxID=1910 RepID=UPI0037B52B6B
MISPQRMFVSCAKSISDDVPGPFRPLTVQQWDRIANVAREASTRVQAALAVLRRTTAVPYPCPHCPARALVVHGGDGQLPAAKCEKCGRTWAGLDTAA